MTAARKYPAQRLMQVLLAPVVPAAPPLLEPAPVVPAALVLPAVPVAPVVPLELVPLLPAVVLEVPGFTHTPPAPHWSWKSPKSQS